MGCGDKDPVMRTTRSHLGGGGGGGGGACGSRLLTQDVEEATRQLPYLLPGAHPPKMKERQTNMELLHLKQLAPRHAPYAVSATSPAAGRGGSASWHTVTWREDLSHMADFLS
ncbi:hypothetical protein E2C01_008335 [Portunus trituberculatus]|uniref:Uncharacterized protein n=1 Tax=Portunus trituberculatus TaxID=210409 RepID=A0A5B7D1L1_PORTR|nr:hypothetical protein [Portunus trituberculatus]